MNLPSVNRFTNNILDTKTLSGAGPLTGTKEDLKLEIVDGTTNEPITGDNYTFNTQVLHICHIKLIMQYRFSTPHLCNLYYKKSYKYMHFYYQI